jgi:hypothetical protein
MYFFVWSREIRFPFDLGAPRLNQEFRVKENEQIRFRGVTKNDKEISWNWKIHSLKPVSELPFQAPDAMIIKSFSLLSQMTERPFLSRRFPIPWRLLTPAQMSRATSTRSKPSTHCRPNASPSIRSSAPWTGGSLLSRAPPCEISRGSQPKSKTKRFVVGDRTATRTFCLTRLLHPKSS